MREGVPFIVVPALLVLAACSTADSQAQRAAAGPDAPLPATVAVALAEYVAECTEAGGKPDASRSILRRDLNNDGVLDFIMDTHEISCEGAASVWGDRARLVSVFVGNGGGDATPAFSDLTWGAALEGEGRNTRLWLGVSSEQCGKPPAKDFASENFCDRAIEWNASTRSFDYAPVSTVRDLK